MLPIALFTFSFALWLGFYLLARDYRQPALRHAGLGLIAYALAMSGALFHAVAMTPAQETAVRLLLPFTFLPPLFWSATMVFLLPENDDVRRRLAFLEGGGIVLIAIFLYLLGLASSASRQITTGDGSPTTTYVAVTALMVFLLLAALILSLRAYLRATTTKGTFGWLGAATLFFALGAGLLLLPLNWLPFDLLLLAIAPDLLLLGAAVAFVDALTEGETLWPDMLHSLSYATLMAAIFGSQIALVMWLATGTTFAMLALLLLVVSTAIVLATFGPRISATVDRLVLSRYPAQLRARRRLQAEGQTTLRRDQTVDPLSLPEEKFARLTRRAFSHMGNLPRLASSPLTGLPQVDRRLQARERADTNLERAHALHELLAESVERLKPRGPEAFGGGDEWRFYNALYFPYVAGLRPYSRRANHHNLGNAERQALDWFRQHVPQRTLYNWQTAAAELVAQDLRERAHKTL